MNDYSIPINDAYRNRLYQLLRKQADGATSKREDKELYDRLMMLNTEAGKSQNNAEPDNQWLRLDTTNDPLRPWDGRLDIQRSSGDVWVQFQHGDTSAQIKVIPTISIEDVDRGDTDVWQDLANAGDDDTDCASVGVVNWGFDPYWAHSDYLVARVANPSLPAGAKNICIRVKFVKSRVSNATNTSLYDDAVYLLNGSTVISDNKAKADQWSLTYDIPVAFYYGADNDAWGAALTPTLINSGTFGVGFSVYSLGTNAQAWAGIYFIEIEIYYDLSDRLSIGYDESTGFAVISPGAGLDGSGRFQFGGSQLLLPATTGTAPIVQSSTTLNANLNADLLDGHHWADALDMTVVRTANNVLAGPATGAAATPTFRALVNADMPFTLPLAATNGGTGVNNAGTLTNASNTTITGGGTLALGGYTLTVPATGTAVLQNYANAGDIYSVAWTDYSATSTIVGWSSFAIKELYYKRVGNVVFVEYRFSGPSDNISTSFTLPYTKANASPTFLGLINVADNAVTAIGLMRLINNTNLLELFPNQAGSNWTASGAKMAMGQCWYIAV